MKLITGSRASAVLYNWLIANKITGKVIIPANICESVPATYMKAGIEIRMCDISMGNWMADVSSVRKIAEAEKCNLFHYNHTFGGGGCRCCFLTIRNDCDRGLLLIHTQILHDRLEYSS